MYHLEIEGGGGGRSFGAPRPKSSFALLNGELGSLLSVLEGADMPPTEGIRNAYADYCKDLNKVDAQWQALTQHDLAAINTQLAGLHVEPVTAPPSATDPPCGK